MFEMPTAEIVKKRLIDAAVAAGVGFTAEEGGFLDHLLGPVALEIWTLYTAMAATLPIAFVDESSGPYIDKRCGEYGITRKAGTRAMAEMTLSGKAGTVVPKGTVFLTAGGLEFALTGDIVLTGGEDAAQAEAVTEGAAYNVDAGEIGRMVVTIPGLDGWTNAAATGGTDEESDGALYGRLSAYLQRPSTSGNRHDYEKWAVEVPGVGLVRVEALWDGPGTVKVLVAGPDGEPLDSAVVEATAAHIEELRPIGPTVTVMSARGLPVQVAATVTLSSATTAEIVRKQMEARLADYIKRIAFVEYTLLYNRVAYLLLGIDGVITEAERTEMYAYRQALRDVPEQAEFPELVVWPELPEFAKEKP